MPYWETYGDWMHHPQCCSESVVRIFVEPWNLSSILLELGQTYISYYNSDLCQFIPDGLDLTGTLLAGYVCIVFQACNYM